jgi:osmotically-inducible protein OsmY
MKFDSRKDQDMGYRGLILFVFAFPLFGAGCNNSDRDHLARAAEKARDKMKGLTGETGQSLTTGWQAMALDARVSARIHWDKTLSAEPIRVQANGGMIELHGKVNDLTQHRRAVELAESTVGAEQVIDLLEVPDHHP